MSEAYSTKNEQIFTDHTEIDGTVTFSVETIIEEPEYIEVDDKYKLPVYDLPDFIRDIAKLFQSIKDSSGDLLKVLRFGVAYNFDVLSDVELVFRVIKRGAGTLTSSEPFGGRRAFKAMRRDILDDPKAPGYTVEVSTFLMDNIIEIVPVSRTYVNADTVAYMVEDMIEYFQPLFKSKGITQLRYLGRENDRTVSRGDTPIYECPLQFYVRTQKIKLAYSKDLEQLNIKVQTIVPED